MRALSFLISLHLTTMNRLSASFPRIISRFPRPPLLSSSRSCSVAAGDAAEFGFLRPEFGREKLAGTVKPYDRHVFLCHRSPDTWPPIAESASALPKLLSSAINAKRGQMKKKTLLTICEGEDESSSSADVLIFPDMIRYRLLKDCDVGHFVEMLLAEETQGLLGMAESKAVTGSYVFVCSHGSRDRRCGTCGPVLIARFEEEIYLRGLQGQVHVKACSHVGGHKYAGNVIIFRRDMNEEVSGHWYGYVAPDNVPLLLEEHICHGRIVDRLWRGKMGLLQEGQKKGQKP